ncbi:UNVERIFIED_CONTAM: hypothetical protein GTU68_017180 [Idotea baltica]|nr:hypothetical protein [Idotea baltica]
MESVEIIMAFEEEFEIEISDSEAAAMTTIGDSVDYIFEKIGWIELRDEDFAGHRLFVHESVYQAVSLFFPTAKISDATELKDIFPIRRRRNWAKVQEFLDDSDHAFHPSGMGSKIPDLERPSALVLLIWIVSILPAMGFGFLYESFVTAFLYLFAWVGLLLYISRPFKIQFPASCQTVGDLKERLSSKRDTLRRIQKTGKSREAVYAEVARIVVDQLGVKIEDCTESARYIEDLGIG